MIKDGLQNIIVIMFPMLIFAQKKNISNDKNTLQPGTSTSISFVVENTATEDKTYDIRTETSSSYIIPILKNGDLKITSKENSVYIVPLKIAPETPPGKYAVIFKGTERKTGEEIAQRLQFSVSSYRKIELSVLDFPELVKAGEIIKGNFVLKNNGNVAENLILESKNAVIDENARLSLAPGETRTIKISKATDPKSVQNEYQNISLSVYPFENPAEMLTAYGSVKIISVKPAEDNRFHRFPVAASVSWVGMKNRGEYNDGLQGELYGKGSLDKDNKNLLEFKVLTKNPVEFNSFTQYEEYFLNYKRGNISIHIGDKNYSSSFLTEYARYGRGAEVRVDLKRVSFGGFYNHPRFFRDIKDEFNLYSKFKIANESEIGAGYLYKISRMENTGLHFSNFRLNTQAHLPYLTGKFKLNKNLEVLSEAAYSKAGKAEDHGYTIQAIAYFEKFNGNIMYMKAGPHFAGYFNNTSTINGNMQHKLSKKVNLMATFIQDARNFQRDTLFLAAPYRRFLQYGIQYKYLKGGTLTLYNGFQRYQDRLMPREFDYKERFLRISIDQQIGLFQFNVEGQFGKTNNYLTEYSGNSNFYTVNMGFEKFKTSFNIYGSYANTARYQLENQKQFYYGARIISRISEETNFSIFYQSNYMPEDYYTDRNLFEIVFHHQIFPKHAIDLSGRYALQRGQLGNKDFLFALRYTLQVNIPVQKTAEYISLSGNIENLGVKRVEGIRLTLGNHLSVTDRYGNFSFKNIVPGNYVLEIDRSTTAINDIPMTNIPASLNLINKENVYNFALTSAAGIQGTIHFTQPDEQKSFAHFPVKTEKKKKESIIIEASNGDQVYRKIAVIGETFDFTYLRPGEWQLKVFRNGLDKKYKIPIEHYRFSLHPSENKNITIEVIKQQAEIKYQQDPIKVTYNEMKKQK